MPNKLKKVTQLQLRLGISLDFVSYYYKFFTQYFSRTYRSYNTQYHPDETWAMGQWHLSVWRTRSSISDISIFLLHCDLFTLHFRGPNNLGLTFCIKQISVLVAETIVNCNCRLSSLLVLSLWFLRIMYLC